MSPSTENLYIRNSSSIFKVPTKEILFAHSSGNYCEIQTSSRKFVVKRSLISVLEILDNTYFIRVHRGYIVNIPFIDRISPTTHEIEVGAFTIPMGRKYKEDLFSRLTIL